MSHRHIIEAAHYRSVNRRRALRHLLMNVVTTEATLWRGWRVCLHKCESINATRPHWEYYFTVLSTETCWVSPSWHVLVTPTKYASQRTCQEFETAIHETMRHMLTLPEREPDVCPRCHAVVRVPSLRARFCSMDCQRARQHKKRGV